MTGHRLIILAFLIVLIQVPLVSAQTKIYRGRLDNKHIQMELTRQGDVMIGSYFYDQFQKDLRLEGRFNNEGRLELREMDAAGRKTGSFVCKRKDEREALTFDLECDWTKPDGSGQLPVFLTEQSIDLPKGLAIKPHQLYERGRIVNASYPELISSGPRRFNAPVLRRLRQSINEFIPDRERNVSFDANYNVLLATDEIISIEMEADSYSGGAHPNEEWWTFNYDVRNDRALQITDLFRDEPGFKAAIWKYAATAINKLDEQIELSEARSEGRQPEKREQPIVEGDEFPEILAWGFTPTGIAVYFDFPHVMAVFTKVVVPYAEVKDYLKPNVPIAKFVR
jgi:hypothetical protein